ncbi:Signal transduction histidine kinase [Paenibacillaceae bacterium GAS479]|nr:Signal transduction histidine kinase [Paenibacillaceae bacterium GAS479]
MLIYFLMLFLAGLAALLGRPKEPVNRWATAFLWLASIGGIAPWAEQKGWTDAASVLELLNTCLTPWAALMFCLAYSGLLRTTRSWWLAALGMLVLPVVSMMEAWRSGHEPNYMLLLLWTAPYYIGACASLILSLKREQDRYKRRSRLIMAVIIVPTLLAVLILFNIGRTLSPEFDFFRYVSFFIFFSMGAAVVGLFLYGVLGIRLKLERDPLESAIRTASMGASMLNHSLKNEIGKISLASDLLRRQLDRLESAREAPGFPGKRVSPAVAHETAELLEKPMSRVAAHEAVEFPGKTMSQAAVHEAAEEQLEQIARSTGRMLETVDRIQSQMKEISWREEPLRLPELLQRVMERSKPLAEARGVRLQLELAECPEWLAADAFHLEETLVNVLTNAIEATPSDGQVLLEVFRGPRHAVIRVLDTGIGISADRLPHVFDPFFSTKSGRLNYGIGLSYAHQAMRMAGGKIKLAPREGGGTQAELLLPVHKLIAVGSLVGEEER